MNRIYQGRVTKVEALKSGGKGTSEEDWLPLDNWEDALWQHHVLFQDAVNYYIIALAAMATGAGDESFQKEWIDAAIQRVSDSKKLNQGEKKTDGIMVKAKAQLRALTNWRQQVAETWETASKKAEDFDGPKKKLAKWLELPPNERDFDSACRHVIKTSRATPSQRAAALMQLFEMEEDLNQTCRSKLPWLASPSGKLDATSDVGRSRQERKRQQTARRFRGFSNKKAIENAPQLKLELFVTKPPTQFAEGKEAANSLRRYFETAQKKFQDLENQAVKFETFIKKKDGLKILKPGRKPSWLYPIAAIFKYFPCSETLAAFREATKSLANAKDKELVDEDSLEMARVEDRPHFDYFTNIALVSERHKTKGTQAVWFEFDLAAFIEAIKAPRRYYKDTQQRELSAEQLRKKIKGMEGRGIEIDTIEDGEEEGGPGFEGDSRIALLKSIVGKKLAWLAESEDDSSEYTIRERTIRRFPEIKRRWRAEVDHSEANLLKVLAESQSDHRDDFGSAPFFQELAKLENHPIWRDERSQPWHTDDPLKAWRRYKDLQFELCDKERHIRFTPAHPNYSPRFFIFPKNPNKNRNPKPSLFSWHDTGQLSFTAGIILNRETGFSPVIARVRYSAPRLHRDQLRYDAEDNLHKAAWLQPMMDALGLDQSPERVNFANCRITLQPESPSNIQLTFPLKVSREKTTKAVSTGTNWARQFNRHPDGGKFYDATLRWPHEKAAKNPPEPWYEQTKGFHCIAVDLGQRHAGAFARLEICDRGKHTPKKARFVGPVDNADMPGKKWYATVGRTGLFRLLGEDAIVWRERGSLDRRNPTDSGKPFDFRKEPWGNCGRPARNWEADATANIMHQMEEVNGKRALLSDNWRKGLSFPEQNDKLLVALRRYQGRIARLHRWCWFLCGGDEQKKESARQEIIECRDARLVSDELKAQIGKLDSHGLDALKNALRNRLQKTPKLLENIANRICPLRRGSWQWEVHPKATKENPIYRLIRTGPPIGSEEKPVWLRGQRGLSFKRIEQIEELRKRCQALNQALRRTIGAKPPLRRDESVPDACPGLLEKLKHIKKQRINQTAHMILAEALGLKLATPPDNKRELRHKRDQHGVYNKILGKDGRWIGPTDLIVIEDLTRYRTSQGRAPRENSRLMKWCHRAVRDKLKELSEVFGILVIESPAAYSSRFCSRTGVPGFRAVEVTSGFSQRSHWGWLANKRAKDGKPTEQARRLLDLDTKLQQAQEELQQHWKEKKRTSPCPKRTLLMPWAGGPIFVPAKKFNVRSNEEGHNFCSAVVQADINAAINLGLRAVADPRLWDIHPRLRTKRVGPTHEEQTVALETREKRKYAPNRPAILSFDTLSKNSAVKERRNPNYFFDVAHIAQWDKAKVCDPVTKTPVSLSSSKALWGTVIKMQWKRCDEINLERLRAWEDKTDNIPM